MIPGKALITAVPLALCGGWIIHTSTGRVGALREELQALDAQSRQEGDSFVRTLRGEHAERELRTLTRRHDVAVALAAARRDRLLGLVLVLFAALAYVFVRTLQRFTASLEQDRKDIDVDRRGAQEPAERPG
jgi:hypothetical protein